MVTSLVYTIQITIVLNSFSGSLAEADNQTHRFDEAYGNARDTLFSFFNQYQICVHSTMASQDFIIDDLQAFLFYPAKTTVGYAPKFKTNRKFFANFIGTSEFHQMLDKDIEKTKLSFVEKLKFCDNIVMDSSMLKDMYDRGYENAII